MGVATFMQHGRPAPLRSRSAPLNVPPGGWLPRAHSAAGGRLGHLLRAHRCVGHTVPSPAALVVWTDTLRHGSDGSTPPHPTYERCARQAQRVRMMHTPDANALNTECDAGGNRDEGGGAKEADGDGGGGVVTRSTRSEPLGRMGRSMRTDQ
jgi:hypothetical protein